ncbi:MAG: F0F1 ATP synthase subunit C [Spirochaetota bacterium]
MDSLTFIAVVSIITAGTCISLGIIGPAIGEGISVARAVEAIAQQPDAAPTISRNLFVGLAMIESLAIYCLVIAFVLIFTNPFWNYFVSQAGK